MKYLNTEDGQRKLNSLRQIVKEQKLTEDGDIMECSAFQELMGTITDGHISNGRKIGKSGHVSILEQLITLAKLPPSEVV